MIINGLYLLAAVVVAWLVWPNTPAEKAAKKEKLHKRGYDWAAGELLRGATFDEIENYCDCARQFGDWSAFDDGAVKAMFDFRKRFIDPRPSSKYVGVRHFGGWIS